MKINTKSVTLLLVLLLVCFSAMGGCNKSDNDTVESTSLPKESSEDKEVVETSEPEIIETSEIIFSHFSAGDNNAETIGIMLDLFDEAYPNITVTDETTGYGEYFNNLVARFASGDAPDVFELNAENFSSFVTRDQVAPISSVVDGLGIDLSVYNQGLIDSFCSIDGELYSLPFSFSTVVMVYNMDMFDAASLDYPNSDWTIDDVLSAAQKMAKPEEDIWGISTELHHLWAFYKKAEWNGGGVISEDGSSFVINSPENIETFQMLQDLVWVQHVMPTQDEFADRGNVDLFAENKLAMCDAGIWAFGEFNERCPDINWGICVEPGITQKGTAVYCNVLCVSASSENQDAATSLANFLCSDPQVAQLRLDAQWELPGVADPSVMESFLQVTPPENKQAVLDSAEYAVAPPILKDFQILADIMGEHLEQLRDGLVTAEEALNAAQEDAEAQINLADQ